MNISTKSIAEETLNRLSMRTHKRTSYEHVAKKDVHFRPENTPICSCICSRENKRQYQGQNDDDLVRPIILPDEQKNEQNVKSRKHISWSAEEEALIQWFLSTNDLPTSSFQFKQAIFVIDAKQFYESLRADIGNGRKGPRALFGALQNDLKCLKNLVSIQQKKEKYEYRNC